VGGTKVTLQKYAWIGILLLSLLPVACVTSPKEKFDTIQVGMHKDAVLDHAGSPTSSLYKNEEAIWTYRIYEGEIKVDKEVRMKNDVVTYIGEPQHPMTNPFDRLKVGMAKADVLDLLGFPKRVEKKGTAEVWIYYDGKTPKSFTMANGKVSALGAPPKNADGFAEVED
jgi:outer membrane protein assembly factor BamE (lipoprotein component of BamABCDE complex)